MPSSPFDAIIGRLVLQFVPDPKAVIKRLYGMLRPGGYLGTAGTHMETMADIYSPSAFASVSDKGSA